MVRPLSLPEPTLARPVISPNARGFVVDNDGTLRALYELFAQWHDRKYGTKLAPTRELGWRLDPTIWTSFAVEDAIGCSGEEAGHRMDAFWADSAPNELGVYPPNSIWLTPPIAGSAESLKRLVDTYGFRVTMVTGCRDEHGPLLREWIRRSNLPIADVVITDQFSGPGGKLTKPEAFRTKVQGDPRLAWEDRADTALGYARAGIPVVLIERYAWSILDPRTLEEYRSLIFPVEDVRAAELLTPRLMGATA